MNEAMRQMPPQFMNWVARHNQQTGGIEKLPCSPDGQITDAHNPANWTSYDDAAKNGLGVAFVLTPNDPYFFIDLDKCRTDAGQWTSTATAIFTSFTGALGEVSTSGKGLHILGKCNPALLQDKRNKWEGWLEFYTQGRFIAFGNAGWEPIGGQHNPDADWTQQLINFIPQRETLGELPKGVDQNYTGPSDDNELIQKMLKSTGGAGAAFGGKATVRQLWNAEPALCQIYPSYSGDTTKFDHSSADAALMAHLAFWTGKDMPRMERLFRQSSLMRPKFERNDYRLKTIQDAAKMCNKVYDIKPKQKIEIDPDVYMTTLEMKEYFKGCVYIADQDRMLTPDGALMKSSQFKAYYGGYKFQMEADNTGAEKNAFVAFTENRLHKFPKALKSEFNPKRSPGEIKDNIVNTFFPQDVVMTPGDISPLYDLLHRLLPDESDRCIFLAWMASMVQNPHIKFQWAPVLQGTEGNGKTFLMNCVAYAIGESFTHRPNPKELAATHNGWMERALFVLVEEIHMDGRRDVLDSLKWKLTNEYIPVRAMGIDERTVRNFSKFGFCTNFMEAVIKTTNDRRYCIFFTAQQSYDDILRDGMGGDYFPKLYKWVREGGYAAIAHHLMTYSIPPALDPAGACHRAPVTSSTATAITKSQGGIEAEILEAVDGHEVGFRGGFISSIKLEELIARKNYRIHRNKWSDILGSLGYVKCPQLPEGRLSKPIVHEGAGGKRPIIYTKSDMQINGDVTYAYCMAQGYNIT